MTKIQTYSDVGLSAIEDIENMVYNRISQAVLNVTLFNFCHVLKNIIYG